MYDMYEKIVFKNLISDLQLEKPESFQKRFQNAKKDLILQFEKPSKIEGPKTVCSLLLQDL